MLNVLLGHAFTSSLDWQNAPLNWPTADAVALGLDERCKIDIVRGSGSTFFQGLWLEQFNAKQACRITT